MHMDFQRVVEDEEIKMLVPIHFEGENVAPGVKVGGGKVSHLMTEVEIVCLPKHLPEYLEIDVSQLELDDMLKMSDIKLPEGVSIPALAQGEDADRAVVSIHVIKEVVIEEEEELEPGAVPVAGAPEEDDAADDTEED
jgi:large subunit ribosomal protein L25